MIKYSILTYVIGDYEVLREVKYDIKQTPYVEFICVTDNPELKSDTWKIIYDEDLDNDNMTCWDKVFNVRYNLFKYCTNDICLRIDGSLEIKQPLDELIDEFERGNYDGCLMIHSYRDLVINELLAWFYYKNYSSIETIGQINYMCNILHYDFNKKGLIEQTIAINRKSKLTDIIDNEMLKLLRVSNKHVTRLDQTMFTALITAKYHNKNWLFIDNTIMNGKYLQKYEHGDLNKKIIMRKPEQFITSYFNDKKIETYRLK